MSAGWHGGILVRTGPLAPEIMYTPALLSGRGLLLCVFFFFFFLKYKEMSKKVFPHVSTRNNVPKKKSFMAIYIQKLVLNFKNLFFPLRFDFIHAQEKK